MRQVFYVCVCVLRACLYPDKHLSHAFAPSPNTTSVLCTLPALEQNARFQVAWSAVSKSYYNRR